MSNNKVRLEKLENIIGNKENKVYFIDPFPKDGHEVIVSGIGVEHYTISIEEFNKIDTSNDEVISIEFV